jgi:F-type H+-transporting ATPase subunit gamma
MTDEKTIKEEMGQLEVLRNLVRAYEEIASFRMKKTRDSVLYNRAYQDSINAIFEEVRTSYIKQARALLKKRGGKKASKLTFLAHNGKTVAVFLSANTGLYGEIVKKTFDAFIEEIRLKNSESTIVGRHGLSLFLSTMPNKPYTYFELPDTSVSSDDLAKIIRHIVQYEEIHVYYGKFYSVIKQEPENFTISAEISLKQGDEKTTVKQSYIFEPSLEEILMFFETEIFASMFEQTVRESQLAKYASRVLAMDRADVNIKNRLTNLNMSRLRSRHSISSKKQLNSLTGVLFSPKSN